jgi:Ca2+-binding RTX toxin-like protein
MSDTNEIFGTNGSDWLEGTDDSDLLVGGRGSDWLYGGDGDDILRGGAGTDYIDGGDGIDLLDFSDGKSGIYFVLHQGENDSSCTDFWSTGNLGGGLGTDYYMNVEGVIGTNYADTLIGSAYDDLIYGGGGRDLLLGGAGDDLVSGGLGNDIILGGAGNDHLSGGAGRDLIYGGSGNDLIASLDDALDPNTGELGGDILFGDGADSVWGVFFGCFGGWSAFGDDVIYGGNGADLLFGDNGNNLTGDGDGGADTLHGGNGNDEIYGEGGNDTLSGGNGNDALIGGAGDDVLVGGAGADRMWGGAGKDVFVYLDVSDSPASDTIADFNSEEDSIDLTALLGDADLKWGDTAQTARGLWHQFDGRGTTIFVDTDGDLTNGRGGAEAAIYLRNFSQALSADDFLGVTADPGDVTPPEVTVTFDVTALNDTGSSTVVSFTFTEDVTGFDLGDVSVVGGTLSDFSGSGASYTATFTAHDDTDAAGSVSVTAGSYADASGNLGLAGSGEVAIDTRNPNVTVAFDDATLNVAGNTTLVTFTFTEAVAGFEADDVTVAGGTLSDFSGSGASYSALFSAFDGTELEGSVSVTGAYVDLAQNSGNGGSALVAIDTLRPGVTVSFEFASLSDARASALVTFAFSEDVTGFDADDLDVAGGSLGAISGSGASYSALFTASDDFDGTGSVTVKDDYTDLAFNRGVGGGSAVSIDTENPKAKAQIKAIANDTGLSASDFITNDTSLVVTGTHDKLDQGDRLEVSCDGGLSWQEAMLGDDDDDDDDDDDVDGDTWSYAFQAPQDGTFDFRARVVDGAGNLGEVASQLITVDTTAASDMLFAFAEVPSPTLALGAGVLVATLSAIAPDTYFYSLESSNVVSGSGTATFVVSSGASGHRLMLAPSKALGSNTEYSVTLKVVDLAGNAYSETIGIYSGNMMAADGYMGADSQTDAVYAYGGNDTLAGGGSDDALFGQNGNDTLVGGAGSDFLRGGAGNDIFDYNAVSDSPGAAGGRDLIFDFSAGFDDIDLRDIDANTQLDDDQAFGFVAEQTSSIEANKVTWYQAGGNTFVHGDNDGDGVADFEIQLAGTIALGEGDFLL